MTIAVLGATGLVGRYIVEALSSARDEPIMATFRQRPPYEAARTQWVSCDLRTPGAALEALSDADCAILCAGQLATSGVLRDDPVTPVLDTLRIVSNVLETASQVRLRRLLMISSCTVYPTLARPAVEADAMAGDPPSQWFGVGWMHRYVETQLRWHVEKLARIGAGIVLRPTLIYGRYDDFSPRTGHFVPTLVSKIVERVRPIDIWGDGEQSRNLLHGSDLASAVLAALDCGALGCTAFNVVSPDDATVNSVVGHLVNIDRFSDAEIHHDLAKGGGPASLSVSGAAFEAATGWHAKMALSAGLADTVAWYRRIETGRGIR